MEKYLLNIAIQALESYLSVRLAVPGDHDITTQDREALSALTELRSIDQDAAS